MAESCPPLSLRSSAEESTMLTSTLSPQLVFTNSHSSSSSTQKVGEQIHLELQNITADQKVAVKLNVTPSVGVELVDSCDQEGESESTSRFVLVPRKYGAFKVTAHAEGLNCPAVFLHVTPMGDLKVRVTGSPVVQLPRDVQVDGKDLIVADGIRKKVIRMDSMGLKQKEFDVPKHLPENDYSPIGLAMKKDLAAEENDELYVTDLNNACVHVYHGTRYIDCFGKGTLKKPTGIAVDDDGCIFVADHQEKRIFQFTPDYRLVEDESPYELSGPQLMTIHGNRTSSNLLVADRRGSKVSVFILENREGDTVTKTLQFATDIKRADVDASCVHFMPFSVICDPDNHIFIAGQVTRGNSGKEGYVWFIDNNSNCFSGSKMVAWSFGGGLRNPGGMRIVEENGCRYLYVTDMRGKNARNCINKYLL